MGAETLRVEYLIGETQVVLILAPLHEVSHGTLVVSLDSLTSGHPAQSCITARRVRYDDAEGDPVSARAAGRSAGKALPTHTCRNEYFVCMHIYAVKIRPMQTGSVASDELLISRGQAPIGARNVYDKFKQE